MLYTFPHLFPDPPVLPSPAHLVHALLASASTYDDARIVGLQEAVVRLRRKSRSFYLASSTFQGLIRSDLMLLYSFCRVADDLVDNAASAAEARDWIAKLDHFLDHAYAEENVSSYVRNNFAPDVQSALLQLPVRKLSKQPLHDLLRGFDMDLDFSAGPVIASESDLQLYAQRVAGTVAQMCNELIFHIYSTSKSPQEQRSIIKAGERMGMALQYVNIARDIEVDAAMQRAYIPLTWLSEAGITYSSVLSDPRQPAIESLRKRLLDAAFVLYEGSRAAMDELPPEAGRPLRVAVESYMEIGRVLRQKGGTYRVRKGRATVGRWRRIRVAWRALGSG